jgi:hypothetical protein
MKMEIITMTTQTTDPSDNKQNLSSENLQFQWKSWLFSLAKDIQPILKKLF